MSNPICCGSETVKSGLAASGNQRYKCKVCGKRPTDQNNTKEKEQFRSALSRAQGDKSKAARLLHLGGEDFDKRLESLKIDAFHRKISKSKRYVITSAQNATPVHDGFFKSLLNYCKINDAELFIIPIRYKNPTAFFNLDNDWWPEEVRPFLCESRFDINSNLTIMADIKTQPTAVYPLSGFESISGHKSAIFAHTTLSLQTVPTVVGGIPKIIATTGAVTKHNYSNTKTGKKGEFHHAFSAQVVEVCGDIFHIRQLNAVRDGSFIDIGYEYTPEGVYYADRPHIVLGDLHHFASDPDVIKATFTNKDSIINTLNPKTIVWHDALDFYSRNHHHNKSTFVNLAKHRSGVDDVRQEIELLFKDLEKLAGDRLSVFPYSNHPDALFRWINEADWKLDPRNAEFYLETALAMVRSTEMRGHKSHTVDPFEYWGKRLLKNPDNFLFLGPRDEYDIHGIKVDMHGHIGVNGSRGGTVRAFAKLGSKTITGHSHSSGIHNGAYRVGTSSVYDMEYAKGPSSWLQTHCMINPNGKRSLINIIDGNWKI